MREYYNTLIPYDTIPYDGIQYGVCRDFDHISRYKGLRQIVHNPNDSDERIITLETPNSFESSVDVTWYKVPRSEENRLDLIAQNKLGSANYSWILAYLNHIEDGYTVLEGQKIKIPNSIFSLFQSGELLASVSPTLLNLGTE